MRRLYPALLATLLLFGAFAFARFLPPLFAEVGRETFLSLLYVVNIYFWRSVDYFGLHVDSTPLLHIWSLAVEEQFYLLFPPICLLVHRVWPHRLRATVIGLGLASFALSLVASGWKPQAAFYLTPTRAWELMVGSVLALSLPGWRLCRPADRRADCGRQARSADRSALCRAAPGAGDPCEQPSLRAALAGGHPQRGLSRHLRTTLFGLCAGRAAGIADRGPAPAPWRAIPSFPTTIT